MIRLKDLQNRVYSGKQCISFEFPLKIDDEKEVVARFERIIYGQAGQWRMQVVFDRDRDKDSDVYNFWYIMPKDNLPLELIAATGLKYFQLKLKQEIQDKSNLDFLLGDITSGM